MGNSKPDEPEPKDMRRKGKGRRLLLLAHLTQADGLLLCNGAVAPALFCRIESLVGQLQ